jgi:hypothetical protein
VVDALLLPCPPVSLQNVLNPVVPLGGLRTVRVQRRLPLTSSFSSRICNRRCDCRRRLKVPEYLRNKTAGPVPLSRITLARDSIRPFWRRGRLNPPPKPVIPAMVGRTVLSWTNGAASALGSIKTQLPGSSPTSVPEAASDCGIALPLR